MTSLSPHTPGTPKNDGSSEFVGPLREVRKLDEVGDTVTSYTDEIRSRCANYGLILPDALQPAEWDSVRQALDETDQRKSEGLKITFLASLRNRLNTLKVPLKDEKRAA